jgi:hypothetical protein
LGHLFTLPKEWPVPDSVSHTIKQAVEHGDVEYFSINGTDFRFQKNSQTTKLYIIEVKQNNEWVTNLTLPMPKETFFLTHDFDLDNYFDLSFLEYGLINVYFFDKTTRHFLSAPVRFSYDYALLDSNKLIYGANNHSSRDWDIEIFSIKGRSKTYLYKANLFLKDNANNGGFEITKGVLYKCKDGKESDTVLLNDIGIHKQSSDFSLLEFMKDIAHNKVYR